MMCSGVHTISASVFASFGNRRGRSAAEEDIAEFKKTPGVFNGAYFYTRFFMCFGYVRASQARSATGAERERFLRDLRWALTELERCAYPRI